MLVHLIVLQALQQMSAKYLKKDIAGIRLLRKLKKDGKSLFTSQWLS
jgi:hypothetical protein